MVTYCYPQSRSRKWWIEALITLPSSWHWCPEQNKQSAWKPFQKATFAKSPLSIAFFSVNIFFWNFFLWVVQSYCCGQCKIAVWFMIEMIMPGEQDFARFQFKAYFGMIILIELILIELILILALVDIKLMALCHTSQLIINSWYFHMNNVKSSLGMLLLEHYMYTYSATHMQLWCNTTWM